jgi:hypothetical protein
MAVHHTVEPAYHAAASLQYTQPWQVGKTEQYWSNEDHYGVCSTLCSAVGAADDAQQPDSTNLQMAEPSAFDLGLGNSVSARRPLCTRTLLQFDMSDESTRNLVEKFLS